MSKVANTIFDTGPKDELVTTDVYKDKGGTSNAERSADRAAGVDGKKTTTLLAEMGKGRPLNSETLEEARKAGLVRSEDLLLKNRLLGLDDELDEKLDHLTEEDKDEIYEALALSSGKEKGEIRALVHGSEHILKASKAGDAKSFSGYLEMVTGNSAIAKMVDKEAEMAIFNAVLKKAIELGIPDAIDILTDNGLSDEAANNLLLNNLARMAMSSDLEGVRKTVSRVGRHAALARVPRLVQYILMFYRLPDKTQRKDYPRELDRLTSALTTVEPEWSSYQRDGKKVSQLRPFTYASADADTVLQTSPKYRTEVMTAKSYRSSSLYALLYRNYPHIALP